MTKKTKTILKRKITYSDGTSITEYFKPGETIAYKTTKTQKATKK